MALLGIYLAKIFEATHIGMIFMVKCGQIGCQLGSHKPQCVKLCQQHHYGSPGCAKKITMKVLAIINYCVMKNAESFATKMNSCEKCIWRENAPAGFNRPIFALIH